MTDSEREIQERAAAIALVLLDVYVTAAVADLSQLTDLEAERLIPLVEDATSLDALVGGAVLLAGHLIAAATDTAVVRTEEELIARVRELLDEG